MKQLKGLIWILTGKCNLNCLHCYAKRFEMWQPEVTKEEVIKTLKEAVDLGLGWSNFSGGELLLFKPWILEILKWLSDFEVKGSIVTNGMFINNEKARALKESEAHVYVSLDGDKESHEKLRGSGTFDAMLRGIRKLNEYGIPFTTIMAVTNFNYNKVGKFVKLSKELGASSVAMIPVMPVSNALNNRIWVRSPQLMKTLFDFVEALEEYEIYGSTWCIPWTKHYIKSKYLRSGNCRLSNTLDLGPNGSALLCDILDITIGSVRKESLKEILIRFERSELIRSLKIPPKEGTCAFCNFRNICLGGCYARAIFTHNKLYEDPLCPLVYLKHSQNSYGRS